jgi:hypothetical protein
MTPWRAVQEQIYQRWAAAWVVDPLADPLVALTPYVFEDEKFDPALVTDPAGWNADTDAWGRFSVKRMPGGPGTLGRPGNRKMDRVGIVFVQLFQAPGQGVGKLSDLGERAAGIFENCRLQAPHDIRFGQVEPGGTAQMEAGRWLGLSVEGRFDYEQLV